jgi:tRNA dimethylallyltransferase
MKGTGYKEFRDYFAGLKNINQTKLDIIRNTLKLAKKQRTWFRRNNSIQWVFNRDQIVDIVTTHLNKF